MSRRKKRILTICSLMLSFFIALSTFNTIHATPQVTEKLFTNEELEKIENYMNENMSVFNEKDLGAPKVAEFKLDNGDEVKITVLNEIDKESVSLLSVFPVEPGTNRVLTVTKDRSGFLGGSMTTRVRYRTLSGSNQIQMEGRSVEVDASPPIGYAISDKNGYFTVNGPGDVLKVKSFATMTAGFINVHMRLDITLTGGWNSVTLDYDWSQG